MVLTGFDFKSGYNYIGSEWLKSLFLSANPSFADFIYKTDTAMINECEKIRKSFWSKRYKNTNSSSKSLSIKQVEYYTDFYYSLLDSLKSVKKK